MFKVHASWLREAIALKLSNFKDELLKVISKQESVNLMFDGRVPWLYAEEDDQYTYELQAESDSDIKNPDLFVMKSLVYLQASIATSYSLQAVHGFMTVFTGINRMASGRKFDNLDFACVSWSRCFERFRQKYSVSWFFGLATKWLKTATASLFAEAADQELPAQLDGEKPSTFLSGIGYVFLHWVKTHKDRLILSNSILMLKKGLPPVHPMEVRKAVKDCALSLSQERQPRIVNIRKTALTYIPDGKCSCQPEDCEVRDQHLGCEGKFVKQFLCPKCRADESRLRNVIEYPFLDVEKPKDLPSYAALPYKQRLNILVQEVRRTCVEVFGEERLKMSQIGLPSISAHFNPNGGKYADGGRKNGGAFGTLVGPYVALRAKEDTLRKLDKPTPTLAVRDGMFPVRVYDCPVIERWGAPLETTVAFNYTTSRFETQYYNWVTGSYQFGMSGECKAPGRSGEKDSIFPDGVFCRRWVTCDDHNEEIDYFSDVNLNLLRDYQLDLYDKAIHTESIVKPIGLPEPLKVRVITKGPPTRYYVGKAIQKKTWEVLSRHRTFRLIGQPVDAEILASTLGELPPGEVWQSADYQSATDFLHPDLSATAAFEIGSLLGLSDTLIQLYVDGLTNSKISLDDSLSNQNWGQLMGSPLSFPVLCLVNAALQRLYQELEKGREFLLADCPILVNGDDVATRIRRENYEFWKGLVSDGGLVPSIGKNYVSTEFLIINSTLFLYHGTTLLGLPDFRMSPYINLALIHPRDASLYEGDPYVKDLSQLANKAVEGFDPEMQDWIMGQFLGWSKVKALLATVPSGCSYFVDHKLGGLGLPMTRNSLLTPNQVRYYSTIAEGLLEEDRELVKIGGGAPFCLRNMVKRPMLWSDWFHSSDAPEEQVISNRELWNIAAGIPGDGKRLGPATINSLIDGEMVMRNGKIKEGMMGPGRRTKIRLGVDFSQARDIGYTWPERTLAKFPYKYFQCEFIDTPTDIKVCMSSLSNDVQVHCSASID